MGEDILLRPFNKQFIKRAKMVNIYFNKIEKYYYFSSDKKQEKDKLIEKGLSVDLAFAIVQKLNSIKNK